MRIRTMGITAGLLSAIAAAGVIFLHPTRAAHVAAGLEAHSMQTVRKLDAGLRTIAQRIDFRDFFRSARL
jgi:hypothetical protein